MRIRLVVFLVSLVILGVIIYIFIRLGVVNPCIEIPDKINPIDFTVTNSGSNSVSLSWAKINSATSYNIYYSKNSVVSNTNYDGKINTTLTKYTITGLDAGVQYYFTVEPINACGAAQYTPPKIAVACVTPSNTTILNASITVPVGNYDFVASPYFIEFDNAQNATGYQIQVYSNPGFGQPATIVTQGFVASDQCGSTCTATLSSATIPASGTYIFAVTPTSTCSQGDVATYNITI